MQSPLTNNDVGVDPDYVSPPKLNGKVRPHHSPYAHAGSLGAGLLCSLCNTRGVCLHWQVIKPNKYPACEAVHQMYYECSLVTEASFGKFVNRCGLLKERLDECNVREGVSAPSTRRAATSLCKWHTWSVQLTLVCVREARTPCPCAPYLLALMFSVRGSRHAHQPTPPPPPPSSPSSSRRGAPLLFNSCQPVFRASLQGEGIPLDFNDQTLLYTLMM